LVTCKSYLSKLIPKQPSFRSRSPTSTSRNPSCGYLQDSFIGHLPAVDKCSWTWRAPETTLREHCSVNIDLRKELRDLEAIIESEGREAHDNKRHTTSHDHPLNTIALTRTSPNVASRWPIRMTQCWRSSQPSMRPRRAS
jgi:hypothetical protein